ncbi:MAG: iron-containing alcohol dehydrogenase [Desulfotignum sp.]
MTALLQFFSRTKLCFGSHALAHLPFDLSAMNGWKPFVLTDPPGKDAGLHLDLARAFRNSDIPLGIAALSDDQPGACQEMEDLYHLFVDRGYDSIMALGTGPLVRTAKLLNLTVCLGPEILRSPAGPEQLVTPLLPMVFVPTRPSEGWETAMEVTHQDRTFVSEFLLPDLTVISPDIMLGTPENQILDAGLTCLAVCGNAVAFSGNPLVRAHAATGIRLVRDALPYLVRHPDPDEIFCRKSRKNRRRPLAFLAHAAALSGIIRANTKDLPPRSSDNLSGRKAALALVQDLKARKTLSPGLSHLLLLLTDPDRYAASPGSRRADAAILAVETFIHDVSGTLETEAPHGDA